MSDSQIAFWTTVAQLLPILGGALVLSCLAAARSVLRDQPDRLLGANIGIVLALVIPIAAFDTVPLLALLRDEAPPTWLAYLMIALITLAAFGAPFVAAYLRAMIRISEPLATAFTRVLFDAPAMTATLSARALRSAFGQSFVILGEVVADMFRTIGVVFLALAQTVGDLFATIGRSLRRLFRGPRR